MDAPSLVTSKERRAIAEEIAAKYQTFASKVSVSFYKDRIVVIVYTDETLEIPSPGKYTIVMKRENS